MDFLKIGMDIGRLNKVTLVDIIAFVNALGKNKFPISAILIPNYLQA